jgi:chromate transporter
MTGPPDRIATPAEGSLRRASEVGLAALQLGLTSFGGPMAHLGYFERAYVHQRKWVSGAEYGNLVALCQILPGPASSQVGFLIGWHRAGWLGGLAAWTGFTLPSALLMYACVALTSDWHGSLAAATVHGLKLAAVAVVAQAVWSMARRLCTERSTIAIALAAAVLLLVAGSSATQLVVLGAGAAAGMALCRNCRLEGLQLSTLVRPATAWTALGLYVLPLLGLPVLASFHPHGLIALSDLFYRAGALVFGGGHVVLPLLREALVPDGWISDDRFLTGYGLAQAIPGPLFTVAAYLGAASAQGASPAAGAAVAVVLIFLPGLLIATAGASLWSRLARRRGARAALAGINAAVVGLLAAALYDPVWVTAVHAATDVAIALVALALLLRWSVAPVAVVFTCVVLSTLTSFI